MFNKFVRTRSASQLAHILLFRKWLPLIIITIGAVSLLCRMLNQMTLHIGSVYLVILGVLSYYYLNHYFDSTIALILYEELDVEKYHDIYSQAYRKEKNKFFQTIYLIHLMKVAYYQGQFGQVIHYGEKVNVENVYKLQKLMQQNYLEEYQIYLELAKILSREVKSKKELSTNHGRVLAVYQLIIEEQPSEYFSPAIPLSKLETIEARYFQSINEEIKGNSDLSEAILHELWQEPVNIYYTRKMG